MPRETVYGEQGDRFIIDVGWARDQHMQLGIRAVDDHHLVDEFYGAPPIRAKIAGELVSRLRAEQPGLINPTDFRDSNSEREWHEELGRVILDAVTGSDYGMSSLWWNPDRAAVNRLIRLLRKARDAAFGRDE